MSCVINLEKSGANSTKWRCSMMRLRYQNSRSTAKGSSGFIGLIVRAVFAIGVLAIGAFVFAFSAAIILSIVVIVAAGLGIWLLQRKLRGLPSPLAMFRAWPPQHGSSSPFVNPAAQAANEDWLSRPEKSAKPRAGVTIEGEVVDRV